MYAYALNYIFLAPGLQNWNLDQKTFFRTLSVCRIRGFANVLYPIYKFTCQKHVLGLGLTSYISILLSEQFNVRLELNKTEVFLTISLAFSPKDYRNWLNKISILC